MNRLVTAAILTLAAGPALAEYVNVPAEGSVSEAADRLVSAAEGAGATIFARVPHSKGAMSVEMELQDAELVIFGNPKLGTPALQADIRSGLVLPLRVLVHDADGQTTITYESVDAMFEGLDIPADAAYRQAISGALDKLTGAAAGG
ncbi:MAG: DUF302 domain-containing protein [Silicimonas sp.]|nr:DUF302 domain-containing protein [Silicimonas sp.]NND18110.1 DUF302 domain-containing protein [Silicimonas sp.]NNL74456.1 DUF302 domain-containing protein [Silicimonas sp.]